MKAEQIYQFIKTRDIQIASYRLIKHEFGKKYVSILNSLVAEELLDRFVYRGLVFFRIPKE